MDPTHLQVKGPWMTESYRRWSDIACIYPLMIRTTQPFPKSGLTRTLEPELQQRFFNHDWNYQSNCVKNKTGNSHKPASFFHSLVFSCLHAQWTLSLIEMLCQALDSFQANADLNWLRFLAANLQRVCNPFQTAVQLPEQPPAGSYKRTK